MKVLIVDDEKHTREGLYHSINWDKFGIHSIALADDGLDALKKIAQEPPDIIISDIRMPRMNGIQLIEQIKQRNLSSSIIFMSGYSDKDYLKAAIRLKAVHYVEKPLNLSEVHDALMAAIKEQSQLFDITKSKAVETQQNEARLATCLTRSYAENSRQIDTLLNQLKLSEIKTFCFISYVVKVREQDAGHIFPDSFLTQLKTGLQTYGCRFIYVKLRDSYYVFHLFHRNNLSEDLTGYFEQTAADFFNQYGSYNMVKGDTIHGLQNVYSAYANLIITLQSGFFFPSGILLSSATKTSPGKSDSHHLHPDSITLAFTQALKLEEENHARELLDQLYEYYQENTTVLKSQAKAIYLRLLTALNTAGNEHNITFNDPSVPDDINHQNFIELLESAFSFEELHTRIQNLTRHFFQSLHDHVTEDNTIVMIRQYVAAHISDPNLSIKEIGEHVSLSVSYLCTYYKAQTSGTLNQYITDYRMKKAKLLLSDPRQQIAEIATQTGYSNSNYFSKSFKKYTGVTPSNYRENMTS